MESVFDMLTSTKQSTAKRLSAKRPSGDRFARLEARLTDHEKSLIERAAAYQGSTVAEFVVRALTAASESVIQNHEILQLNAVQSRAFVESLLKPREPNATLRKAARDHRRTVTSR